MNDPLVEIEAIKVVLKDFFRDFLIEMKGFKYQITLKNKLGKQKQSADTEFSNIFI